MGCKASKATQPVNPPTASSQSLANNSNNNLSSNGRNNKKKGSKKMSSSSAAAAAAAVSASASSSSSPTRVKKSILKSASKGGTAKSSSSSSLAAAAAAKNVEGERLYQLLVHAQTAGNVNLHDIVLPAITTTAANYQNANTKSTPLHMAVRLLDVEAAVVHQKQSLMAVLVNLLKAHVNAIYVKDAMGNIPLHYAISSTSTHSSKSSRSSSKNTKNATTTTTTPQKQQQRQQQQQQLPAATWETRASVVRLLMHADPTSYATEYMTRNNITYTATTSPAEEVPIPAGGCSALYRALETIPDDFDIHGPTVQFMETIVKYATGRMVGVGNASDGDKPLALLYRRFTRQFDLAEKFFSGDNSRPAVVEHRRRYKTAAGNTWKIIETLFRASEKQPVTSSTKSKNNNNNNKNSGSNKQAAVDDNNHNDDNDNDLPFHLVHRAVQVETPPDLLRYIVETNSEDLTLADEKFGRLPLHYAAMSKPSSLDHKVSFPAFYSKYVMDELLYKYPEAASQKDAAGNYPLALAVRAGKHWIGGGIKSLYDAFPEALKEIDLNEHHALKKALSIETEQSGLSSPRNDGVPKEEKMMEDIIRDEQHDAIMLVQQPSVDVSEVVTSMWAHEEDPGVQMLGCVALAKMLSRCTEKADILRIALSAVPAVVNSMKAHPNEVIVQEKACMALKGMAWSDGRREVSFVASGAVAAIVGAMQAHVSDAGVQEHACGAIAQIIKYGGDDRATIVASVSGLTALVNALAAHPTCAEVQRNGCEALKELTEFTDANLPELPQSQVEPLLETARTKFPAECGATVKILLSRMTDDSS